MNRRGFTIVELIIVVVVIGILASVIIISFSNVSDRATVSSLSSDLANAKKQLLNFQVQSSNGSFPTAINCTNPSSTEICIKASGSNKFTDSNNNSTYKVNNLVNPAAFTLTATNGNYAYEISDSSANPTLSPVSNGLVLNLDAFNTSSYSGAGTAWNDLSTRGNNGTFTATPTYSTSNSGGINFNATYWVNFTNTSDFWFLNTAPYTIEAWFRPTINPGLNFWAGIVNRESSAQTGSREGYNLWFNGSATTDTRFGAERFSAGTNRNAGSLLLDQSQTVNKWHQIVSTYDGLNTALYRNGSLFNSSGNANLNIINNTRTLTVGARETYDLFTGTISVIRIYNKALSASEVSQNFNALRGRYGL